MPREKNKHMTINDRLCIEQGLQRHESFASIARMIGVSTSTVSHEVGVNRTHIVPKRRNWNLCIHKRDCKVTGICSGCSLASCVGCRSINCNDVCDEFEENTCDILKKAPFVCGDCYKKFNCGFRQAEYRALDAQLSYEMRLVETREGISLKPEELESMVHLVRQRLQQGWSIEAIWAVHCGQLPVCERTMYSYVESGVMGLANIDLPKKVKYKPRHAISGWRAVDRDGRSYSDFCDLPAKIQASAVQMDTVIGLIHDHKNILTIHIPRYEFQIMILLDEHTCASVVGALDWIEQIIGTAQFSKIFGVILTDRGIEFGDFEAIERSALGRMRRCRVFFCDPMRSGQKGSCEKNHGMIRRILPKKTSFEDLTQYDISTVCSHVNSYPRKSLDGKTPHDLASRLLPRKLFDELGIEGLKPEQVVLKPSLLK